MSKNDAARKGHHHHAHRSIAEVLADLKKSKLKLTRPRKAILQALVDEHGPFTAEEIHKLITKRVCDLATVYRCLANFEEIKMIHRCDFGDGIARYELAGTDEHHHHHLICNDCKRIEIVDDDEIADELDRVARKRGFSNVSHSVEFFGTCPNCR